MRGVSEWFLDGLGIILGTFVGLSSGVLTIYLAGGLPLLWPVFH